LMHAVLRSSRDPLHLVERHDSERLLPVCCPDCSVDFEGSATGSRGGLVLESSTSQVRRR
jgi:hypothetical protein